MSTHDPDAEIPPPPEGTLAPSQIQPPPVEYAAPATYVRPVEYAPPAQYATSAHPGQPAPPQGFATPSFIQPPPPTGYFPPPTKPKGSVGKIVAIILLSLALTGTLAFMAITIIQLNAANSRISEQQREIKDQQELIDKKETFGAAMHDLLDTATQFDGLLTGDVVPFNDYETIARDAWNHRWDGALVDADTATVIASTRDLETLLSDANNEASTNMTGSTYEAVIDQLGEGFVSSRIEDADTLCKKDVLACVMSENPYAVHFDAGSNGHEYMNEWLRTGVAYHEFAHVLQFTNSEPTETALVAFDGDHETMADCFALTYLDGWTLDHTVWVGNTRYWEVNIGYGYTCNDSQRQTVIDWYGQLGYTTRPISQ